MKLPIAESFFSIQGEGRWVGTPMYFLRLAGCSVGKGSYPFKCTKWDGLSFTCDTDFRKIAEMDPGEVVHRMQEHRVKKLCITGGEPLMHELDELVEEVDKIGYPIHVETSGVVSMPHWMRVIGIWVTLSPKMGFRDEYLRRADEVKLLVDARTQLSAVMKFIKPPACWPVYLQPIGGIDYSQSLARCMELIRQETKLKLSIQMHKVIGAR